MFAATAVLAGVHGCSLAIIHWCATSLEGVAADSCNMYVSAMHAYGFDPCWRHQRCMSLRQAQGQVLLLSYPVDVTVFGSTLLQQ